MPLHLALDLFVAEVEHRDQRRRPELLARHHHGIHPGGFPESAQKLEIREACAAQGLPLGKDDGPRVYREAEEEEEDSRLRGPAALDHSPYIYLKKKGNRRFERQSCS